MSVWIKNLEMALNNKPVIIIYGNVRDSYIDENKNVYSNLTNLILNLVKKLQVRFEEITFYDSASRERTLPLIENQADSSKRRKADISENELEQTGPSLSRDRQDPPERILARWINDLNSNLHNKVKVIFYFDKLISYRSSYGEEEKERLIWLEKIIENITPNNRLIIVSLLDSMLPIEIYTHSPKCKLISVPLPDKDTRHLYLHKNLGDHEHLELIANLTDGLYLNELENVVQAIREAKNLGSKDIYKLINLYKVGIQQDYWSSLSIEKLDKAFDWFVNKEGVKGQDEAVKKIIDVLCLARAGLSGMSSGSTSKPRGVLFFAGPTGVGKTFLAKKLAKFLFDTEDAFIRFDMSEFKEEHTISKFIGSPPGYVGYEQGGLLTNSVRQRPFSVILFDEIEKAHPKIMDIFLQILDDGRLTDSRGQTVFFTESVIIFTSNLGCRSTDSKDRPIDEKFKLDEILSNNNLDEEQKKLKIRQHFIESVNNFFLYEISRPELLNRIGNNIVPFNYIQNTEIQKEIVKSHLKRIKDDFEDKYKKCDFKLIFDEEVINYIVSKYGNWMSQFGGRGITSSIENEIMIKLSRSLLQAEYNNLKNVMFEVKIDNGKIKINRK